MLLLQRQKRWIKNGIMSKLIKMRHSVLSTLKWDLHGQLMKSEPYYTVALASDELETELVLALQGASNRSSLNQFKFRNNTSHIE